MSYGKITERLFGRLFDRISELQFGTLIMLETMTVIASLSIVSLIARSVISM